MYKTLLNPHYYPHPHKKHQKPSAFSLCITNHFEPDLASLREFCEGKEAERTPLACNCVKLTQLMIEHEELTLQQK